MIRHYLDKLNYFFIRKTIKYIIWDFDGTLYQSQKLGHDLYLTFLNIAKTKNKKLSQKKFDSYSEDLGSWSAATSKLTSISEFKILDLADTKINKLKYIKKNRPLIKIIESTSHHYHHLILTNSTSQEVLECLPIIGFSENSFEKIFSRDTTHLLKPNPQIYNQILAFTKTPKFRHLFIGDSYAHDIKPTKSLGFQALPIWEIKKIFS